MRRVELACLTVGALLLTVGVAAVYWPAGLMTAGVLLLAAGLPRASA